MDNQSLVGWSVSESEEFIFIQFSSALSIGTQIATKLF